MNPYQMFKTNEALESEKGKELNYGEFQITIHRAGGANQKYAKVASTKLKPYARQLHTKTADPKVIEKVMAEIYAEAVIIGWKNVKDGEGKAMAFNKTNVVKLLTDLPELFADIQRAADDVALFREEELEADAKTLRSPNLAKGMGA